MVESMVEQATVIAVPGNECIVRLRQTDEDRRRAKLLGICRSVISRGLESSSPRDFFCRDFDAAPAVASTGVN